MRLVMEHLGPHHGAQFRHQDRRRRAGRDPAQPDRDRGLSRRGRAAMTMLSIAGLRAGYGKIEVLHDVALDGRARADRHADRRQRRRQDHAAEDHLGPDPPDRRQRSTSKARASCAARRTRSSARGISHVPEGRAILKRMTVLDNLRMGAYRAQRRRGRARHRRGVRALSGAGRAARPDGRHAVAAASSRCWRSAARWWRARGCCCSTSPRSGSRRNSSRGSSSRCASCKQEGKTILLVEQNARQALQVADTGYVMERGRIAFSAARAQALLDMPEVRRTYLGQSAA